MFLIPTNAGSLEALPGSKKAKDIISCLSCSNADDIERIYPMAIGTDKMVGTTTRICTQPDGASEFQSNSDTDSLQAQGDTDSLQVNFDSCG